MVKGERGEAFAFRCEFKKKASASAWSLAIDMSSCLCLCLWFLATADALTLFRSPNRDVFTLYTRYMYVCVCVCVHIAEQMGLKIECTLRLYAVNAVRTRCKMKTHAEIFDTFLSRWKTLAKSRDKSENHEH